MATIILEDYLTIPDGVDSLPEFRAWTQSPNFPSTGRIDFIDGQLEVDMSPENLFKHGNLKSEIVRGIGNLIADEGPIDGYLFTDCTRVSCPIAGLSAEPDVVYVSQALLSDGSVELVPSVSKNDDDFVELQGGPDLIVEIVSSSSLKKDTERLPVAYFAAGVKEYWLVNALGDDLSFTIFGRGEQQFEAIEPDANGFAASNVFQTGCRLTRKKDALDHWRYRLEIDQ